SRVDASYVFHDRYDLQSFPTRRSSDLPSYKSTHRIFHSAVSALDDRVLLVGILTNTLIEKLHQIGCFGLKVFPVFYNLRIVFIKKVEVHSIWTFINVMDKIGIGTPGKIMYIRCDKMPSDFLFFLMLYFFIRITMSYLFRVLKISSTADCIAVINIDFYIVISPNTIKLSANIRICMPTFFIISSNFRKPLRHR